MLPMCLGKANVARLSKTTPADALRVGALNASSRRILLCECCCRLALARGVQHLVLLLCLESYNPTATLLEHALLPQGLMGVSKVAFPRRLQLQNRNSTGENLSNAIKCRCRVKRTSHRGRC